MAFGGKLSKESVFEFDGMTFTVPRMSNFARREIANAQKQNNDITDNINALRDAIMNNIVTDWSGVTLNKIRKYFVSDLTHYGAKEFDVNGDPVSINRASARDIMRWVESERDGEYSVKADLAINELLDTKDAKINYNGTDRKMNASIRSEIIASPEWEEVTDFVISKASSYSDFEKPDDMIGDMDAEIEFSKDNVQKYMLGDSMTPTVNIPNLIHDYSRNNENYREKLIKKDEDASKN